MYLIIDSYGTRQTCWTWAQALDWLRHCSPNAVVLHRLTKAPIAGRRFVK